MASKTRHFQVDIPPSKLHLETTVSKLINEKYEWNEELIQQYFLRDDAEQITKIPLQDSQTRIKWCSTMT